ncbi:MAG: hypothetical protein WBW14_25315 [Candidatus Acidiferrum sp.]
MKTPDDRRKELPWLTDNSIPAANPADLKTILKLQNDLEKQYGWQGVIMGIGFDQQGVLSPGANFGDVFYRLSWLRHLQILSEADHLTFHWIHDGEPEDAVFKALAIVPMTGRRPGVMYDGPPFDVEELIRLIKRESEAK